MAKSRIKKLAVALLFPILTFLLLLAVLLMAIGDMEYAKDG